LFLSVGRLLGFSFGIKRVLQSCRALLKQSEAVNLAWIGEFPDLIVLTSPVTALQGYWPIRQPRTRLSTFPNLAMLLSQVYPMESQIGWVPSRIVDWGQNACQSLLQ
jgi:hypothetical protein